MGVHQYTRDLGLGAHATASALGNTFDKGLVGLRLEAGLLQLLNKDKDAPAVQGRVNLHPREAAGHWSGLLDTLRSNGVEVDVLHPYPEGLRDEVAWEELGRSADAWRLRSELVQAAALASRSDDEEQEEAPRTQPRMQEDDSAEIIK
eukprot:5761939-Alexandrium_andersonii.AAC.1